MEFSNGATEVREYFLFWTMMIDPALHSLAKLRVAQVSFTYNSREKTTLISGMKVLRCLTGARLLFAIASLLERIFRSSLRTDHVSGCLDAQFLGLLRKVTARRYMFRGGCAGYLVVTSQTKLDMCKVTGVRL